MTDQPIVVATDLFSLNMWPFQRMFKALSLQVNFNNNNNNIIQSANSQWSKSALHNKNNKNLNLQNYIVIL